MVRTWLSIDEDIGHYRIIWGYDDRSQTFIQDDSYHGKNIHIPYDQFEKMWKAFHYEYLVLAKPEEMETIASLIGEDSDMRSAWNRMSERAKKEIIESPSESAYSYFTLSVASFYLGDYQQSFFYYEISKKDLPKRMLWYQIEPLHAYLNVGNYEQLFLLTSGIFNDENRGFSELYTLRAKAYLAMGNDVAAKGELQQAVSYNEALSEPKELLLTLD